MFVDNTMKGRRLIERIQAEYTTEEASHDEALHWYVLMGDGKVL